jgi:hypothetical protein
VKQATEKSITGDAKLNALSFFNLIKDLKLTDIPDTEVFELGDNQKEVKQTINDIGLDKPNNFPFRFPPMLNEDFYDDMEFFEYNGIVNEFNADSHPGYVFHGLDIMTKFICLFPMVPCLFIEYLIKTLAKSQKYTITLPELPLLQKLILATNKSTDYYPDAKNIVHIVAQSSTIPSGWADITIYSVIKNPNEILGASHNFKIKETGYYRIKFYLNIYDSTSQENLIEVYSEQIGLRVMNGPYIHVNNTDLVYLEENTSFYIQIYKNNTNEQIKGEIKINLAKEEVPLFPESIYINKHVPDVEQIRLFSIIKALFNVGFYVDEMKRNIEAVTFNEIMTKTPIPLNIKMSREWSIDKIQKGFELKYENSYDESEHPETINFEELIFTQLQSIAQQGDYAYIINEANLYFFDEDEEEWTHFNIWNQEHKIEEDDMISFDIPVALTKMEQIHENYFDYLMPIMEGKGESFLNKKTDTNDYTILIYEGKQIIRSREYSEYPGPLASITKYNGKGNIINPEQSLLLDDLEENFYQKFINFLRTSRELKFTTKMKIADFMKLRLQEKYTADGYVFIIKSMKMSVTVNNYSFVETVIAVI